MVTSRKLGARRLGALHRFLLNTPQDDRPLAGERPQLAAQLRAVLAGEVERLGLALGREAVDVGLVAVGSRRVWWW